MSIAHVIEVEIDAAPRDDLVEAVLDALAVHHVAAGATAGPEHLEIAITLDEPDLQAAVTQALHLVAPYGTPVALRVTPEDLRDQRAGLEGVDFAEILSPTQAADIVGVSRQAIHQLLKAGRIRGSQLTDKSWILDRASVQDYARRRRISS